MRNAPCWFSCATAIVCLATSAPAQSVTTAFSYNGMLRSGGSPANGSFDIEFRLYNAASGGSQIGAPVTLLGQDVEDGLIAAELSFGAAFSDGGQRWLQVGVRPAGGPSTCRPLSGTGSFFSRRPLRSN